MLTLTFNLAAEIDFNKLQHRVCIWRLTFTRSAHLIIYIDFSSKRATADVLFSQR